MNAYNKNILFILKVLIIICFSFPIQAKNVEGKGDESSATLNNNRVKLIETNIVNALHGYKVLTNSLNQAITAGNVSYNPDDKADTGCLEFPKSFEEKFIDELISWAPIPSKIAKQNINWLAKKIIKKTAKALLISYNNFNSIKCMSPESVAEEKYISFRKQAKILIGNLKTAIAENNNQLISQLHKELDSVINNAIPQLSIPVPSKLARQSYLKQLWQDGVTKYNWPVSKAFQNY